MASSKQTTLFGFVGSKRKPETKPNEKESSKSGETKPKKARKFNADWKDDFPWLRYDEEFQESSNSKQTGAGFMFCRICEAANKVNGFTKGCINFQKSALKEHRDSASHHEAVVRLSQKTAMESHMTNIQNKNNDTLTAMMRTVLFMAQENVPTNKFKGLIDLQKRNGCSSLNGIIYSHSDTIDEMEGVLADCTIEKLKQKMSQSRFVGLIMDETVNVTVEKKLIMFARIVHKGKAETIFLGNYTVHSGNAECITDKVREVMEEWDISFEKLIGLGTDGASVMTGRKTGVGVRLTQNSPFLIHVHCIAHRVALASQDAAKLSGTVTEYRNTLNQVYKLYQYSATRYARLRELSEVLDDSEFSSIKQPCTVRWLSLGRAVKSTKSNLPALVFEIEEEGAERNNTAATGISKKLKTYSFIATTYMLSDVLPIMEKLVTVFQRETLNLSIIKPMVSCSKESLQELLTEEGEHEKFLNENLKDGVFRGIHVTYADTRSVEAFKKKRACFIQELINSLDKRFPDKYMDILQALDNVLNSEKYPDTKEELSNHGGDSLTVLLDHFCPEPAIGQENADVMPHINRERSIREFQQFKRVNSGIGAGNFDMACKILITEYADIFPDFSILAEIALTIPVSSVPAERGFSLQNRIHTASRNRLAQRRMNNLMILNMHAQDSDGSPFDFTRASEIFRKNKKRKV